MNKYLYKIKDLEIPPWIKYWFLRKSKINFDLSQILNGTNFDLENSVNKKLHLINIFGNSNQDGIPTPENPIEEKSSGDNGYITENIVNKNLFNDKINITQGFVNGNSGTITPSLNYKVSDYININGLRGKTIYINWVNSSDISYALYDVNKTYISGGGSTISIKNGITIPSNASYLRWAEKNALYVEEMWSLSNNDNFEEHQEQFFTIPCQQPMRAIGNVKDMFIKVNGVWYERHNINKIIFNGSNNENWVANETNTNTIRFVSASIIENDKALNRFASSMMNNTFKEYNGNQGIGNIDSEGIAIRDNFSGFTIRALISRVSNLDGFKLWLSTHNVIVNYVLKDPIDLPCTQAQITALNNIQKAKTYKDVTHIYSNDEVPANLEIQYYKEKEEE